jgi:transcriptional regulator GlxA family with amidase domain
MAKELLESSKMSLSHIAEKVGFNTEESLRKHFRRCVLISPIKYRRQFATKK